MSSKAFIILGNQLFPTVHLKDYKDHIFFMAEDYGLCTYVKHHKQKILLFYLPCVLTRKNYKQQS
jgi:Uncharacterized protein related to deoxyribodipyrimidine photolyase